LIVAICLLLVQGQHFAPTFTSPVFMWSNTQYFGGKNVHVNEYTPVDYLTGTILKKETGNPLAQYFTGAKAPEVIFVFLEPELRTEQFPLLAGSYSLHPNGGAFSKLKGTLESFASSSLVIPYTHVGEEEAIGTTVVEEIAKQLDKQASIIIASKNPESFQTLASRASRVSLEDLKKMATKDWNIFSNGVTDIVVVCFDSPAVHASNVDQVATSYATDDAFVHDLLQKVQGSYLAIFTADKSATETVRYERASMMVKQLAQASSSGLYPPDVIEAQIVMIPLLLILAIGIICTFGVQSDLKFDAEKKTFKK